MLVDPLDTFITYVRNQLNTLNATVTINGVSQPQRVAEVINARDWPLTAPVEGVLYLLFQKAVELPQGTQAQQLYEYMCMWVWLVIGQDIQANQQGANRGSRYRTNMQILSNLRQAHYAGFCPKTSLSADSQGNLTSTPVMSEYPYSNVETIWWSRLSMMPRNDNQKSGITYGAAAFSLFSFEDVSVLVA